MATRPPFAKPPSWQCQLVSNLMSSSSARTRQSPQIFPFHKWSCTLVRSLMARRKNFEHQLNISCQVPHDLDRETLNFSGKIMRCKKSETFLAKPTNFTHTSLKALSVPEIERTQSPSRNPKNNSQRMIFIRISYQRVERQFARNDSCDSGPLARNARPLSDNSALAKRCK